MSAVTPPGSDGTADPSFWAYLRVSLSVVVLIMLVALGAAVIVVPAATGSTPLTVLTSSMEPGLPPGTLLVVKPVEPEDVRIGDVVTYQLESGKSAVVTHRVIQVNKTAGGEYSFVLQGDNNSQPDPEPIREVQVQGRLWYSVPYVGWVNTWVNGEARGLIVPIVASGLFAYAVWMVISGMRDKARARTKVAAASGSDPVAAIATAAVLAPAPSEEPKPSGRRRAGTPLDPPA